MSEKKHAKDCKCIVCGEVAVSFWPYIDPDIPSYPYCRECLSNSQHAMLVKLMDSELDFGISVGDDNG